MPPKITRLKRTEAFSAAYRRGRWAHGSALSVGVLPHAEPTTRIGLRTRRGLKGAVVRNRLKRQLRSLIFSRRFVFRVGLDVVVVIHPRTLPVSSGHLERELITLCKRVGAAS